jgi:hypothetical protein
MMLPVSETLFALIAAMLDRLPHMAEGGGALLFGFLLDRLEFVAHSPASAITGFLANIFIVWWLTQSAERSANAILSTSFQPSSRGFPGH